MQTPIVKCLKLISRRTYIYLKNIIRVLCNVKCIHNYNKQTLEQTSYNSNILLLWAWCVNWHTIYVHSLFNQFYWKEKEKNLSKYYFIELICLLYLYFNLLDKFQLVGTKTLYPREMLRFVGKKYELDFLMESSFLSWKNYIRVEKNKSYHLIV